MVLYKRREGDSAPLAQADPFIFWDRDSGGDNSGDYYIYASGREGAHLFHSKNLFNGWEYGGVCLSMPGQVFCWAPCAIRVGGRYYMYYSSILTTDPDEHSQRMRVAVSDSAAGPFRYEKDLMPPFSIDSHVVSTPSGLYMFYSVNDWDAERFAGTYIRCDKMAGPLEMEGRSGAVVRPSLPEEVYQKDRFKKGQDWHTIEGAFYFYAGGTHFVMYSGANHTNPTYFIGYATAKGPEGADLRALDWRKQPDDHTFAPLVRSNASVEGMGHNSVLADGAGRHWIVYHGRAAGDLQRYKEDSRVARIDELVVDGAAGRLSMTVTP